MSFFRRDQFSAAFINYCLQRKLNLGATHHAARYDFGVCGTHITNGTKNLRYSYESSATTNFQTAEHVIDARPRTFGARAVNVKLLVLALALSPLTVGVARGEQRASPPKKQSHYDPRNFDGVWHLAEGGKFGPMAQKDGVTYVVFPFTPEYQAIYDQRLADAAAGNPYQTAGTTCLPSGAIRLLTGGGPPLEIFHTPKKIAILKENGGWSRIYLNRGHLPADELYPMFYGDSIGHWEGNTLVVDTISLGGANNIDGTAPHSDAAHLVQRISRPTIDTLRVEATLEDPKALLHPVTATAILKPIPDEDFTESFCTNERNIRDADGKQTVKMSH
jgi:hypothetical protein